jgi:DNA-binding transcriptional LysR family regulator
MIATMCPAYGTIGTKTPASRRLSPDALLLFAAVAERGGISAAARALGRPKSSVSRELAQLEAAAGARLVQRTSRALSLTEAGRLLLVHARRVVEEVEAAELGLAASRAEPMGELRVSAPPPLVAATLAPILPEFLLRHPGVRLALDATTRIVDLVEEGFDVAIRVGELPPSSLVARRLATPLYVLVASPGYLAAHGEPSTPSDLAGHAILDIGATLGTRRWRLAPDEGGEAVEAAVEPRFVCSDLGAIRAAALAGGGIGPVSASYVERDLAAGRLQRVLPGLQRARAPIHAVYPSRRELSPKVRAFVDFLVERMTE